MNGAMVAVTLAPHITLTDAQYVLTDTTIANVGLTKQTGLTIPAAMITVEM